MSKCRETPLFPHVFGTISLDGHIHMIGWPFRSTGWPIDHLVNMLGEALLYPKSRLWAIFGDSLDRIVLLADARYARVPEEAKFSRNSKLTNSFEIFLRGDSILSGIGAVGRTMAV